MKLREMPKRFWIMVVLGLMLAAATILTAVGSLPRQMTWPLAVLLLAFIFSVFWNLWPTVDQMLDQVEDKERRGHGGW